MQFDSIHDISGCMNIKTNQKTLSRLFRPKRFDQVYGQTGIITTLTNSLKNKTTSQAYLFTGIRGTGKTTLARIFAKALNCQSDDGSVEPCNNCISCKEIDSSSSLSVIEIDGASNRGIDDIRELNETAHFGSSDNSFKIIIIDEVHMLTKEAFNALLKTLEEPPAHVKFFFATTEVNKIPATILSRTQRFDLKRLSPLEVLTKLKKISSETSINIDDEALKILARKSEGSLRDAESLLQQLRCYEDEMISQELVQALLGIIPQDFLFKLDQAYSNKDISFAFDHSSTLYSLGPTISTFIESLLEHYRNIALLLLKKRSLDHSSLTKSDLKGYQNSLSFYSLDKVTHILDYLSELLIKIPTNTSKQIHFEMILLHIIQTANRVTIQSILESLPSKEIETTQKQQELVSPVKTPQTSAPPVLNTPALSTKTPTNTESPQPISSSEKKPPVENKTENIQTPIVSKKNCSSLLKKAKEDTILRFASVELGGALQKI